MIFAHGRTPEDLRSPGRGSGRQGLPVALRCGALLLSRRRLRRALRGPARPVLWSRSGPTRRLGADLGGRRSAGARAVCSGASRRQRAVVPKPGRVSPGLHSRRRGGLRRDHAGFRADRRQMGATARAREGLPELSLLSPQTAHPGSSRRAPGCGSARWSSVGGSLLTAIHGATVLAAVAIGERG